MAFKQGCFIRKNTPELRAQLEKLGYEFSGFYKVDFSVLATTACNSHYSCVTDVLMDHPDDHIHWRHNRIDCGTNEKAFLAIASLRNDTDRNQWFICKQEYISTHSMNLVSPGTWQLNTQFDKLTTSLKNLWRKATAKEIVEHFNN